MTKFHVLPSRELSRACFECQLNNLCLPIGISRDEMDRLDQIVKRGKPIHSGQFIYRQGDSFTSLYMVTSGSVKCFSLTFDGKEQIDAFHLPGEIIGLDAICGSRHASSAIALETTSLCELPFDTLEKLALEIKGLSRQLMRIMSRELGTDERFIRRLANQGSDEKLAGFILNLSSRFAERGYSSREFRLSMSRRDIANYLGLAVETVSRIFTQFQSKQLIEVHGKSLQILDFEKLNEVAGDTLIHGDQSQTLFSS